MNTPTAGLAGWLAGWLPGSVCESLLDPEYYELSSWSLTLNTSIVASTTSADLVSSVAAQSNGCLRNEVTGRTQKE